jgi:coenzyme F420 hydrogenase subunit beta
MKSMGNFEDLEKEVIEKGLCTHCGACISACPDYNIKWGLDDRPRRDKAKGMCENCTECYDCCHRVQGHFINNKLNKLIFNRDQNEDESFGIYKEVVAARAKDKEIIKISQDGGVVSAIGLYLLDKQLVDGIITTGKDQYWKPVSDVVTNREELLNSAGTKYYIAPVLKMLKDGIIDMELDRLAVIGLPCQIRSARYLQQRETDLSYAITHYIGLFCTQNYEYKNLSEAIEKKGLKMNDVNKMDVKNGAFHTYVNGTQLKIPLKETKTWVPDFCKYCDDYTAEYADISIGSQGSDEGWSTVIIRSEGGRNLFTELIKANYIEIKKIDDYKIIDTNSNKKHQNVLKIAI